MPSPALSGVLCENCKNDELMTHYEARHPIEFYTRDLRAQEAVVHGLRQQLDAAVAHLAVLQRETSANLAAEGHAYP